MRGVRHMFGDDVMLMTVMVSDNGDGGIDDVD